MLASANPKKVAEIRQILGDRMELVPRPSEDEVPEVVEDADTVLGNARHMKRRANAGQIFRQPIPHALFIIDDQNTAHICPPPPV